MELLCINPKGRPELEMLKVYHWDGEIVCPKCGDLEYYLEEFPHNSSRTVYVFCGTCNHEWDVPNRASYDPNRFVTISETEMEHLEEELFCVPVEQQAL